MLLLRGQRVKLTELTTSTNIQVGIMVESSLGMIFDISCFGVDINNKLSDDRYFIFYNQKISPCGSISSMGAQGEDMERFQINLSRLPQTIRKLVLTINLDGEGIMSQIKNGYLRILDNVNEMARFSFAGSDFGQEKAIIVGEIYFKDVWRISAVGQGFNGGLSALLKHFGGEEIAPEIAPQSPPAPAQISKAILLQKRLENEAPHLINLAKKLSLVLEKKHLQDTVAKVALVLDASGSMALAYENGTVQAVMDRMVLIAARLDDDQQLEIWFYASSHAKFPDISIENVTGYLKNHVKRGGFWDWGIVKGLGVNNNEPPVMQEVLNSYKSSNLPALIIFITDGGIYKTDEIQRILIEASRYPIFWQFVGLAGVDYGVLEQLDTMKGRVVDNAGFFHVDDLARIDDEELYNRLLSEFPSWLKEVKKKSII